jgi:predicted phosphodiesterase
MRVAILSDVHANLEALKATTQDLEKQNVEEVHFLGDAVGYGADPNACIKLIDSICDIKLLGNHDYVALGLENPLYFNQMARESILWTQQTLKGKSIEIMSDFEMEETFLDYHLVHATPENPQSWNYLLTVDDAQINFKSFPQDFCFIGHSHIPAIFCLKPDGAVVVVNETQHKAIPGCRYIINVGSVGQPRDGNKDACYLIANTDDNSFEFRRVSYDLEKAQKKMEKANLPKLLISRLAKGE